MIYALWVLLAGVVVSATLVILQTVRLGIPPMPSSSAMRRAVVAAARSLCAATTPSPHPSIIELGSGWGGLARLLATSFPESAVIGVERSVVPLLWCSVLQAISRLPNLTFVRADLHEVDIEPRSVVVTYLSPDHMSRLAARIGGGAQVGAAPAGDIALISCAFALPGIAPERTDHLGDLYRTPVYTYRFAEMRLDASGSHADGA